jgi:hypothetical protein
MHFCMINSFLYMCNIVCIFLQDLTVFVKQHLAVTSILMKTCEVVAFCGSVKTRSTIART